MLKCVNNSNKISQVSPTINMQQLLRRQLTALKNSVNCLRCPTVTIKKIWNRYKKLGGFQVFFLFSFFFLKISRERKLMRTRRVKGNGQKISRPAEIYELQLLPVCVLCCLMAAVVSDWQCANATHSVQTRQHREPASAKLIIKNTKMKMHAPPCRGGVCRLDTLARTQGKKMLRART